MADNSLKDLLLAFISLQSEEECQDFLEDLCAKTELERMAQRLEAAKCLLEGDTYEEVIEKTKISSATLSRVSRCLKTGKGYRRTLEKIKTN